MEEGIFRVTAGSCGRMECIKTYNLLNLYYWKFFGELANQ